MKKTESERFVRKVLGLIIEKTLSRRKRRFAKVLEQLRYTYKIEHPDFEGADIDTATLDEILEKLRGFLSRLVRGEVVMDTLSIKDVHIIAGLSRISSQSHTALQVDQGQKFGDAIASALLLIIHFHKIRIFECRTCKKLTVRSSPKQRFCDNVCRQKHYRDHRSPGKTREIRLRKSARRRARGEEN